MSRILPIIKDENTGKFATQHGMESSPEYQAWANAIYRCETPTAQQWPLYGARGISVCRRWRHSFAAFLSDMGARPSARYSLERVDVNGNYEPGNCRWATPMEQSNNRRNTFRIGGMTLREMYDLTGIPLETLKTRAGRGWGIDRIMKPVRNKRAA